MSKCKPPTIKHGRVVRFMVPYMQLTEGLEVLLLSPPRQRVDELVSADHYVRICQSRSPSSSSSNLPSCFKLLLKILYLYQRDRRNVKFQRYPYIYSL